MWQRAAAEDGAVVVRSSEVKASVPLLPMATEHALASEHAANGHAFLDVAPGHAFFADANGHAFWASHRALGSELDALEVAGAVIPGGGGGGIGFVLGTSGGCGGGCSSAVHGDCVRVCLGGGGGSTVIGRGNAGRCIACGRQFFAIQA